MCRERFDALTVQQLLPGAYEILAGDSELAGLHGSFRRCQFLISSKYGPMTWVAGGWPGSVVICMRSEHCDACMRDTRSPLVCLWACGLVCVARTQRCQESKGWGECHRRCLPAVWLHVDSLERARLQRGGSGCPGTAGISWEHGRVRPVHATVQGYGCQVAKGKLGR